MERAERNLTPSTMRPQVNKCAHGAKRRVIEHYNYNTIYSDKNVQLHEHAIQMRLVLQPA